MRRPSRASATSTRVVFVPMSMQPQSMRARSDVAMMGAMTSGVPAIEVTGLSKAYGSQAALRGVDFTVARGEVFGLLGPNGAGKTTTVEVLEGYRDARRGRACACSAATPGPLGRCARGSGSSCRAAAPIRT